MWPIIDLSCSTGLDRSDNLLGASNPSQVSAAIETANGKNGSAGSPSSSRIPPELWLQMFSDATHIPGAYTHTDQEAFYAFTMDTHGISVHRRHREATDTMLAVSRVCKLWASLAADFLFKYLLIKSGDQVVEITAALERHASRADVRSARVGERTVRLELALDGVHVWTGAHTVAFERIIAACPNITVLSTAFSTGDGPLIYNTALVHALELGGLPSNVRRLELSGNGVTIDSILPRLSRSTDLLWIRPTGHTELANISMTPVELPRLRCLVITADRAGIPPKDWNMPQLQTLRMDSDLRPCLTGQTPETFLQTQGWMLRTLDATQFRRMNLRFCPNLVECTVPISLLETLFANVPIPPLLRRLIFDRICEVHAAPIEPRNIARFSLRMREEQENGRLPPFYSIRFLLPIAKRTTEPPREVNVSDWEYAVEHLRQGCEPLGIALEASIGADEHTANIWQPLSYEHFLGA